MRLTSRQTATIKQLVREHFGAQAQVRLFGSRADDSKRGGDIDLYIQPATLIDRMKILEQQLALAVKLKFALGDQRIDLVIDDGTPQAIYKVAREQGVLL